MLAPRCLPLPPHSFLRLPLNFLLLIIVVLILIIVYVIITIIIVALSLAPPALTAIAAGRALPALQGGLLAGAAGLRVQWAVRFCSLGAHAYVRSGGQRLAGERIFGHSSTIQAP